MSLSVKPVESLRYGGPYLNIEIRPIVLLAIRKGNVSFQFPWFSFPALCLFQRGEENPN